MPVGADPIEVYLMKTLLAEFSAVSVASGYFTDPRTVSQPGFMPDDLKAISAAAQDGPAILLWADSQHEYEGELGIARDRVALRVLIVGAFKRASNQSPAIQSLAVDVRRVLRNNVRRKFPGTSTEIAINTVSAGSPAFDYLYFPVDQSTTVGMFFSTWDIVYDFPNATG